MKSEPSKTGFINVGQQYTVSDGKMVLVLEEAEEGGFVVSSPLDPGLWTQAETLQEAFRMAYDAAECLAMGRKHLAEQLRLIDRPAESVSSRVESHEPERTSKARARKKSDRALES